MAFASADFPIHAGLELLHQCGDFPADGVDDGLRLLGALADDFVFPLDGGRLGLEKSLFIGRHLLIHGFLETFDLGFRFFELFFPLVNHTEDRLVEKNIKDKDKHEEIDDLDP